MELQSICEYVDVVGDRLQIAVRLNGADCAEGTTFVLRLRSRSGRVQAQATAPVQPRVNTVGVWSRSALVFEIAAGEQAPGAFRLELVEQQRPDTPIWLVPSAGLLAGARPQSFGRWRMQVFPAAGRPAVWLRLGADTPAGRLGWSARNALRELAFVAHLRRFTWVRAARLLTRPLAPRGPIWLIGERPETARDNGRALFAHARRVRPDAAIYYVITAQSSMRQVVEPLGNVVVHSSWQHRLLMLHTDVLINAYSIKHMLPSRWHPGAYMKQCSWRIGAYRVYLKHGVHLSPYALKRANGGYDLVATVGPGEAQALATTSGYTTQLVQTGLARYDNLVRVRPGRTILFMPTWRRYLVPTLFGGAGDAVVAYAGSTYQRFIQEFLSSDRLARLLADHDLTLQVVPHYNLRSLLRAQDVTTDRVRVLDAATADIPALLRSCDLLVTDYSSVQFDVAYLGTPVVYCQFDQEEFAAAHGAFSWFEAERDGFGPVTRDVDSTVAAVARYAESGFTREPVYDERVRGIFAHDDRRNCDRLMAAIDALSGPAG